MKIWLTTDKDGFTKTHRQEPTLINGNFISNTIFEVNLFIYDIVLEHGIEFPSFEDGPKCFELKLEPQNKVRIYSGVRPNSGKVITGQLVQFGMISHLLNIDHYNADCSTEVLTESLKFIGYE